MGRKQSSTMIIARQLADQILREQTQIRLQMMQDVALITASEVLGLGPGRAQAFIDKYIQTANEIAEIFVEDGKDDKQLWYSKAKLDERIKAIVGEDNFKPYEQRYGAVRFGKDRIRADDKKEDTK